MVFLRKPRAISNGSWPIIPRDSVQFLWLTWIGFSSLNAGIRSTPDSLSLSMTACLPTTPLQLRSLINTDSMAAQQDRHARTDRLAGIAGAIFRDRSACAQHPGQGGPQHEFLCRRGFDGYRAHRRTEPPARHLRLGGSDCARWRVDGALRQNPPCPLRRIRAVRETVQLRQRAPRMAGPFRKPAWRDSTTSSVR